MSKQPALPVVQQLKERGDPLSLQAIEMIEHLTRVTARLGEAVLLERAGNRAGAKRFADEAAPPSSFAHLRKA